jgi:hemerythrin
MKKIEWTTDLAVGIDMIDDQHKKWIQHLNELVTAAESRRGANLVTSTLAFLIEYTDFHFSAEERAMEAAGYPALPQHRVKHEELRNTLGKLVEDFSEEGATHELADSICTFLGNWLVAHIREVDQAFGRFTKEKNLQIT